MEETMKEILAVLKEIRDRLPERSVVNVVDGSAPPAHLARRLARRLYWSAGETVCVNGRDGGTVAVHGAKPSVIREK